VNLKRLLAFAAVAVTLFAGSSAADGASKPFQPTITQVGRDVATAVTKKSPPNLNATIPPIVELSGPGNGTINGIKAECYPQTPGSVPSTVPSNPTVECAFGDLKASRMIFIFGDSQSAMWLPALVPAATALKWRVVFLAHTGCPPWPGMDSTDGNGDSEAGCLTWVEGEIAYAEKAKPAVVMPIGQEGFYGKGLYPPLRRIESEQATLAKDLPSSRLVFVTPFPSYHTSVTTWTPTHCLISGEDIRQCEFSPAQLVDQKLLASYPVTAKRFKGRVVDITKLFCTSAKCALFVSDHGNRLIYLDQQHANRYYTAFIAGAFEQLLKPALP
jgi:hypothetical protein